MGNSKSSVLSETDEKLYTELCEKIQNKSGVDRLVRLMKEDNPDKSANWIYKKILNDIEKGVIITPPLSSYQ